MSFTAKDGAVLRRLAGECAEIASLPCHNETIAEWKRLNSLGAGRPLLWINEVPWHEFDACEDLRLQCEDPLARSCELQLRRTLYQWKHFPGDMVVEPVFRVRKAVRDTGFGLHEISDVEALDPRGIRSRRFKPQIQTEQDIAKIRFPEVSVDNKASEYQFEAVHNAIGDILDVESFGIGPIWFSPWDQLITWYGVEQALTDLVLRPELVHAAMDRLVSAWLHRLDQYERLGLLDLNNGNFRIGSGGLGYTDELPRRPDFNGRVTPMDQWGCATAQIFSDVSPAMHDKFALQYERRWLHRFGLTYYGCCEPLDRKIDMLRSVENLRKISMSPWVDLDRAAAAVGSDFVFSWKPTPALLAQPVWNPDRVRRYIREALAKTRGCVVEIILKDISTVCYEPQRLDEWEKIARDEIDRVY